MVRILTDKQKKRKAYIDKYSRTKKGIVTKIYSAQRYGCRKRGYAYPKYARDELEDWLYSQELFHELFKIWEDSGYETMLIPSVDRINDYETYSFDNIRLMTWGENKAMLFSDRLNKLHVKGCSPVEQLDLDGNFIARFDSVGEAMKQTNSPSVSDVCRGKIKTSGGFKWRYL